MGPKNTGSRLSEEGRTYLTMKCDRALVAGGSLTVNRGITVTPSESKLRLMGTPTRRFEQSANLSAGIFWRKFYFR